MHKKVFLLLLFFLLPLSFAESIQQFGMIGDLKLEKGGVLKDCKVGYRTFGNLNSKKSNTILIPTWFAGVSKEVVNLLGPQGLVDTTDYFIVVVDALGNGISTSPTNYFGDEFPSITIRDMVNSEYLLLKNILSVDHLFAIIGGSMGSMQAFEFAVAYPNFVDKIIPYAASPKVTSNDKIIFSLMTEIITSGKKYGEPEDEIIKKLNITIQLLARTPEHVNRTYPDEKFKELEKRFERPSPVFTSACYLAQLGAMVNHDITRDYRSSFVETAKHVSAKFFIIVSETDLLLNPKPAVEFAEAAHAKLLILKNDCGHLAVGCELAKCREEIGKFLND